MNEFLQYINDFTDIFFFWKTIGFAKFLRFFWFFFIFEIPRYVLSDMVVLTFVAIRRRLRKPKMEIARKQLLQENPLVSIVIPGKNEGGHLHYLIKSLNEQTYKNFEIIVIDDGSDDETQIICRNLLRNHKIDRYLRNDVRGGKASASNFGWRHARGRFIVHIDADCSFDRDAIEKILVPFFYDPRIGIVGGDVKVREGSLNLCTALQAIEYLKSITVGRIITSELGILRVVSGAFGAFRKEIVDQVGGWDVGPGMDGDITVKTRKSGFRVRFAKEAVCYTSVPKTWKALARQRTRWSRSLVRFRLRKHKDVYYPDANFSILNMASFVENVFFSLVLDAKWLIYIVDIVVNFPVTAKYIIPINFLLYVLTNMVQFVMAMAVSERARKEWALSLYLPLMPFYMGVYMRVVRTWAYIMELFFHSSYKDTWNPMKVSRQAKEVGL
mgnify:FL=1